MRCVRFESVSAKILFFSALCILTFNASTNLLHLLHTRYLYTCSYVLYPYKLLCADSRWKLKTKENENENQPHKCYVHVDSYVKLMKKPKPNSLIFVQILAVLLSNASSGNWCYHLIYPLFNLKSRRAALFVYDLFSWFFHIYTFIHRSVRKFNIVWRRLARWTVFKWRHWYLGLWIIESYLLCAAV